MPITFTCPCGQALAADDEHAGLRVQCPACPQTPVVPYQLWDSPPAAKPWQKGAEAAPAAPVDPNNPFGFTNPAQNARERARQVQERENPPEAGRGSSFEGGVLNSGVVGGALAMLGAVVWFVVGLALDIIFFYPPVLFIIGLVAFIKGLAAGPQRR